MSYLTLLEKMRTGHVNRWQIVRTARDQTLAEHLYLVYTIVHEIAGLVDIPPAIAMMAERWALIHDLPEVITGDIATPIKAAMKKAVPETDPVHDIEMKLDEDYSQILTFIKEKCPVAKDIVKLADLMEACFFLRTEGMGDHAESVLRRLKIECNNKMCTITTKYPEYNWLPVIYIKRTMLGEKQDGQ